MDLKPLSMEDQIGHKHSKSSIGPPSMIATWPCEMSLDPIVTGYTQMRPNKLRQAMLQWAQSEEEYISICV